MEIENEKQPHFPLLVSKPVLDVLSVIHEQAAETITLDFETIGSERIVLALHDRRFGFWDEHNLGKIMLQAVSLIKTEVTIEAPPTSLPSCKTGNSPILCLSIIERALISELVSSTATGSTMMSATNRFSAIS